MSFYPFENPIGFGASDFFFLAFAILALLFMLAWKPRLQRVFLRLAENAKRSMIFLAAAPVILRLLLIRHHPVPTPDIYDEFSHLLVADTLLHLRLANPAHPFHRFFETSFVLQEPTYSSIYPIGQGIALAFGKMIFGHPWAGVLAATAALCSLTYWMLRAWTTPGWSLVGGILAVIQFGPLSPWMNSYWGGAFAAAAGCLLFGSLPRWKSSANWKDGAMTGVGLGLILLIRPYESIFVFAAALVFLFRELRSRAAIAALIMLFVPVAITLRQDHSVTGHWLTLPYQLSQHQYGVPASLTVQADPSPHRELTPQQAMQYKAQLAFKTAPRETVQSFLLRLEYRVRFYRFFFVAPLYIALLFLFPALRELRFVWITATLLLYICGMNLFPAFQLHYLGPITCLFVLISVIGLERLSRSPNGLPAAQGIVLLCIVSFAFWYAMHLFDRREFSQTLRPYETWDGINHENPERRIAVNQQLAQIPGKLLIFVRYSATHPFQEEWIYNEADIDRARIVWARDLGSEEDAKLRAYYPDRQVFLLEPDFPEPRLDPYE